MASLADLFSREKGEQVHVCSYSIKDTLRKKEQDNYLHGSRCQLASPGWGESSGRRKTVQTRQGVSSGTVNRCHHNKPSASNFWAYVRHKKILSFDQLQRSTCRFAGHMASLKHTKYKSGDLYHHVFSLPTHCFYFWHATVGTTLVSLIWNRSIYK